MLVDRVIKKELSELVTLEAALPVPVLDGSAAELLSAEADAEPGSVVQVTFPGALLDEAVGGLLAGGGGVHRQPLELMTPANSATCSSSSLLR